MPRSTISSLASAGSATKLSANASSGRIPILPVLVAAIVADLECARHGGHQRCVGTVSQPRKMRWPGRTRPSHRISYRRLVRQRIGPQLEVRRERLRAFAALDQPWRAIAVCGPQPTALPSGIRIVDAAVEALGIEA